ncbi:uncharacterized protein SPPG_05860 [Spizellomyces punctatus DAOM BR117]|uniref:Uncharacterized protein n=1 Tax=Spizellomyces punctatus (strain DAOM BR117) TaxID=645134 RepID=A0A0L0HBD1_SPIPD|nr:uncharacterized protein SPPG_05860 [Spizellomyces punctatus DAOM BR117]KNC98895.1 hypothetical protein SPPG_05860 [Spizellomyces punctatus DAOM BR117]|eukprot:XP_016606935.1 hypothetical protein SPPG_05860 [Spizellomyces punctatus DAOM BR117]
MLLSIDAASGGRTKARLTSLVPFALFILRFTNITLSITMKSKYVSRPTSLRLSVSPASLYNTPSSTPMNSPTMDTKPPPPSSSTSDKLRQVLSGRVSKKERRKREGDVNSRDDKGRSALHFACAGGHADLVTLLLDRGADVDSRDVNGNTPLHLAVCSSQVDVVLVLLRANANVDATDHFQRTPLQLVQSRLNMLRVTECTETLLNDLRKLIEILSLCTTHHPNHSTTLDPALLTERLERITTTDEAVRVVDELKELLERLKVDDT